MLWVKALACWLMLSLFLQKTVDSTVYCSLLGRAPLSVKAHCSAWLHGTGRLRLPHAPQIHTAAPSRISRRLFGCSAVQDVGRPPSASACGRSKCWRFGCRRTAKLRALTRGSCLTGAPWRGGSSTARQHLLRPQVASKDSQSEAFGDAGCRARFFAYFLIVR